MSTLSVVVVPLLGGPALETLIEVLLDPEVVPTDAQLVVVGRTAAHHARVHHVAATDQATIPERRVAGLRETTGDVVAFLEDTTRPNPGWGAAILALHRKHPRALAIGGPLEAAPTLGPAEQALVALDYGRFLRRQSGVFDAVPGNNMSFKRSALKAHGAFQARGFREAEFVVRLMDGAHVTDGKVRIDAKMGATCVGTDDRSTAPLNRWFHGRLYAGNRFESGHWLERIGRAGAAPLLAGALVLRGVAALRRAEVQRSGATLRSLVKMSSAWALGEGVGYVLGPGDAEQHWK